MCDYDTFNDMQKAAEISRRQFGALGLGAGFAAMLPAVANAADVSEAEVTIKTPDGNCDAHFVYPKSGTSAAVLVWPDVFGLRDPFRTMGKRLAESGYAVLTVNPFYRQQKAPTSTGTAFTPELQGMMRALTPATHCHRCEVIRRLARCTAAGGQEAQDRHHRLLHGRPDRVPHSRHAARAHRRRRHVPWRRPSTPPRRTARTCSFRR